MGLSLSLDNQTEPLLHFLRDLLKRLQFQIIDCTHVLKYITSKEILLYFYLAHIHTDSGVRCQGFVSWLVSCIESSKLKVTQSRSVASGLTLHVVVG